jgi:hypothetical protein
MFLRFQLNILKNAHNSKILQFIGDFLQSFLIEKNLFPIYNV